MKPLSPNELEKSAGNFIPDTVIEAVNNLLIKNYRGGYATFTQKELENEIRRLDRLLTPARLYENHWMDFERLFEKQGWKVEYDKPGYNEDYEANFAFTKEE